MEGVHRPGHFKGVVTIVKKLFDVIHPDCAYFGEKDFQQLAVIRYMTKLLKIPVKITGYPTIREPDGLALSSRNLRLTPDERKEAPVIYKALSYCKTSAFRKDLRSTIQQAIEQITGIKNFKTEYLEIVDSQTLKPLRDWSRQIEMRACVAVNTSTVRLIDNISI